MTFLAWLAALVSLLTGLAMLKDTYFSRCELARLHGALYKAAWDLRLGGWDAVDRDALSAAVRFLARITALVLIVASSGVCLLKPQHVSFYESLLRCALTVFMAMQAPCPWVHFILRGDRRKAGCPIPERFDRRVH